MDGPDSDPISQFFPDDPEVDLYTVLELSAPGQSATADDIKKAYRKAALRFHPDKVAAADDEAKAAAVLKFQQIGFAYAVLSDEVRRKRYDTTGATAEGFFDKEEGFDWNEYFKEMWTGVVNKDTLAAFELKYKGRSKPFIAIALSADALF